MDSPALMEQVQLLAQDVLMWVGFGTLVGLAAKAIMPGRDPGGAVATLLMGIAGTVLGCALLSYLYEGGRVSPISVVGFAAGTGGAFVLLVFYRILGGFWFKEGAVPPRHRVYRRPVRRRTYVVEE